MFRCICHHVAYFNGVRIVRNVNGDGLVFHHTPQRRTQQKPLKVLKRNRNGLKVHLSGSEIHDEMHVKETAFVMMEEELTT